MQNTAEYDQIARTALHHVAQALKNQEANFTWRAPQIVDAEQMKKSRTIKYILLFIFAFMFLFLSLVTFLLVGIDEFLQQKGDFMLLTALNFMWAVVILLPLLSYWFVLRPMQAEIKRGWRIFFYQFNNDSSCLNIDNPYSKRKHYLYFNRLNQFPHVFPLPTQPSEQERALQKYIHEQIEQRTGLQVAEKP